MKYFKNDNFRYNYRFIENFDEFLMVINGYELQLNSWDNTSTKKKNEALIYYRIMDIT